MNDEKLIELIHGYSALYDMSNSKYMDSDFKNSIWSKVGAEMKMDGSVCKTRWANIRDNFRKSLNKQKTKSGQQATKVKPYKYSEQLNFLKKFFEERETKTNIEINVNIDDFTGDTESEEVSENRPNSQTQDVTISEVNDDVTTQSEGRSLLKSTPKDAIPRKIRKLSVLNSTAPSKTAAATAMEYIIERNKIMNCPPPTQHPVDAFLAGIASSLKKLSPQEWHYAKGELFATVQRYELNLLNRQQQYTGSAGSSEMCSIGEPSPAGSYQSPWSGQNSMTSSGHIEENAAPNLTLTEYFQSLP
ncbi:uncharacterized protein LOC115878042 [Sitophilus oryzae]|uniref:Uncharacterized protein LOC115878042 n=1 Tax=Sitophilus oryzae TaxID=7048 RepID=A0A6J2XG57_SITOR|nr:uncharacterized protein LOC115878042 [Sitophilus oryzae]